MLLTSNVDDRERSASQADGRSWLKTAKQDPFAENWHMAFEVGSWHTAGWIGRSPAVRLKEESAPKQSTKEYDVLRPKKHWCR